VGRPAPPSAHLSSRCRTATRASMRADRFHDMSDDTTVSARASTRASPHSSRASVTPLAQDDPLVNGSESKVRSKKLSGAQGMHGGPHAGGHGHGGGEQAGYKRTHAGRLSAEALPAARIPRGSLQLDILQRADPKHKAHVDAPPKGTKRAHSTIPQHYCGGTGSTTLTSKKWTRAADNRARSFKVGPMPGAPDTLRRLNCRASSVRAVLACNIQQRRVNTVPPREQQ
jgi:hypothetical protein